MKLSNAQVRALRIAKQYGSVSNNGDGVKGSTLGALAGLGLLKVEASVEPIRRMRGLGVRETGRTYVDATGTLTARGAEELALWEQANNTDADGHPIA